MLRSKKSILIILSVPIAAICLASCVSAKLRNEIVSEVRQSLSAEIDTKIDAKVNNSIGLINDNSMTWNDIKPWIWIIGLIMGAVVTIFVVMTINRRKEREADVKENLALAEHKKCHDSVKSTKTP